MAISPASLSPSEPVPEPEPEPPKVVEEPEPKTSSSYLYVDKEVVVEVERRIPGSFNYESAGENVSASSTSTSPIDVIGVLSGIWRRFHVRG